MGNSAGKLNTCFCPVGAAGEISRRHDIAVALTSNPLDEGFGHSFCYIRPPEHFAQDDVVSTFLPTISGASVSANTTTPLSTALFDPFFSASASLDFAASFESSPSFASVPLQPIPRNLISSGPLLRNAGSILGSGPIERGFLSGPIERGFMSGPIDRSLFSGSLENRGGVKKTEHALPLENSVHSSIKSKHRLNKWRSIRGIKDAILGAIWGPMTSVSKKSIDRDRNESVGKSTLTTSSSGCSSGSGSGANLSSQGSLCDDNENNNGDGNFPTETQNNLQWAQGKAGEDRVHVVVSEEHGWVFVGIYDGFNGPDATDFLLSNLYPAAHKELKGVLWNDHDESDEIRRINEDSTSPRCSEFRHSDVLAALSEALRKTEEAYLDIADRMILENPVLSLMGSCVLVMLMVGEDVYLMNVGDSRAVLGQRTEEKFSEIDPFDDLSSMEAVQLTVDHNTIDKEEVKRLKGEHPNDHGVIANDRVKGSLKVTRAFGAGFLKNPKWNKGLLEMFKIDYVGSSPYITCSPSLHHQRISAKDKFLILSSDGLYQYFTNEEAVTEVEQFMVSMPEGDPAQHLIEEVLFRAAKKAGMEFHELLDIPQGERRRYHDDVFIIIVSFEGRTWQSSL